MNSSFTIKQEIEVFEEEIVEHYPTPIMEEFMPFKCEKMKADEITIHTEPSRLLQEPLDIPIYSDGEANICLLCQYVEGVPLTSDMRTKRSVHKKWCLRQ